MAFDPNLFVVSISPDPARIVLGKTGTVSISASNFNPGDWGYNLSLEMTIPDGVSFVSAGFPPTSQTVNPDYTITLVWLNIKDLAPNETGYTFPVTLQADETFRTPPYLNVPFDIALSPVSLSATVDTKPRDGAEPGNIQYTKTDTSSVLPVRYAISKSVPGKMPKGASTPPPAAWPYQHEIVVDNNTRQASLVNLTDVMDNGIRFIGPITAAGPDAVQFLPPNPVVVTPSPGGQDYVSITWTNRTLSPGSINTISYDVAIWDNYTVGGIENSGSRILHQTPLDDVATLSGASGPVTASGTTLAMDLTIDKSQSPTSLDIGVTINYTLDYRVNQYDGVNDVIVTDVISDGQTYQVGSAVPPPSSVSPKNPLTGETTVTWNLGPLATSTSGSITFSTVVDAFYTAPPPGRPVVAGDTLDDAVDINGSNANFGTPTPDNSASSGSLDLPTIRKEILNYYYKDGTLKPPGINAAAPGDLVEFRITYTHAPSADQKDVYIDDFFPLALDASALSSIVYSPFPPLSGPLPTGLNGVEWLLNTFVPGMTTWTVTFRAPMLNVDFVGSENNLAKMKLMNTDGTVYSARDQVEVNFGEPDMTLTKNVAGPSPTAILSGQTYTYTVVIGNPQNGEGTVVDAFDLDFSDTIPALLTYTPGTLTAVASAGTPSFTAPTFTPPDQIAMHINVLKPDDEITVTYQVTVDPGIGPELSLTNLAHTTSPYSQPFDPFGTNYQYPGLERSASTTLTSAGAPLTKTVDFSDRVLGDKVNYTLTWTVPGGLTAYNVVISDVLPTGQSYDNNPSPVPPASVIGQVITWPTIPVVDATAGPVTLVYSFRANIDSAVSIPPTYIDIQTDTGRVNWDSSPTGFPHQRTDTENVNVRNPHLTLAKAQRNVSQGQVAFVSSGTGIGGDIIEYRLRVTNDGSADAYSITIVDQPGGLPFGLSFISGSIVAPPGTSASYSGGTNQISWNIPFLAVGATLDLLFRASIIPGLPPGTHILNTGRVNSYANVNGSIYPPVNSNTTDILVEGGIRGISLSDLQGNITVISIKTLDRRLPDINQQTSIR